MQALVTAPSEPHSTRVADAPEPSAGADAVLIRPLEVGVCGTDREISEGLFGVAPDGEDTLVLGHELLGEVEREGHGFARGDLVTATVRRSCGHCAACAAGAPDACDTGDYLERGITRLHGFASELVAESPEHVVAIPRSLGRLGVLAEPASICERGLRHVRAVGARQPWTPRRALVLGAGAIGMLATYLLRMDGLEVWTATRTGGGDRTRLVEACGARHVVTGDAPPATLAEEVGGFDVVLEAAGDAQLMLDTLGLLRRNGVACLLGIDGRPREVSIDGRVLAVDAILQNRALFGSVNANRVDWDAAVAHLDAARERWPAELEAFVGLRVPLDDFEDAFCVPRCEGDPPAMRYLVTGALGAIGTWTIRSLLDHGHDVVTYDLGGSDHRLRLALNESEISALMRVNGDVTDLGQLEGVIDDHGVTAVIHLAALQVPFVREDPIAGARVNVLARSTCWRPCGAGARACGRSSTRRRSPRWPSRARIRARSTGSSSSRTRAPRSATSPTTASRRSACARTRSTDPAATRA